MYEEYDLRRFFIREDVFMSLVLQYLTGIQPTIADLHSHIFDMKKIYGALKSNIRPLIMAADNDANFES